MAMAARRDVVPLLLLLLCTLSSFPSSIIARTLTLSHLRSNHPSEQPWRSHESASVNTSIPSILKENGLPIGLLPSSVESYDLSSDGSFTVSLGTSCYVMFDYEVYYSQTITGKLSYGTISNLSGIQAKQALVWFSVTGIRVDIPLSDYIYFNVGPISKKLSISQFEDVPTCKSKASDAA